MNKLRFATNALILAVLGMALVMSVPMAKVAHAVDVNSGYEELCSDTDVATSTICESRNQTESPLTGPNGLITRVTRIIALATGIAAVVGLIISGLMYVASAGDPGSVKRAKDTMLYSVVGVIVALLSQAIVVFIMSQL